MSHVAKRFKFYPRRASELLLTTLEPQRNAIIAQWRAHGLIRAATEVQASPASLRLVLIAWLGEREYEDIAYQHRASNRKGLAQLWLRAKPLVRPPVVHRRWAEFPDEERAALLLKVETWLTSEAMARRRQYWAVPGWEEMAE